MVASGNMNGPNIDTYYSSLILLRSMCNALTDLGFVPSMGGCNIWILNKGDYYSYVSRYCNDMIVVYKDPEHVFDFIRGKRFTIKDTLAPY